MMSNNGPSESPNESGTPVPGPETCIAEHRMAVVVARDVPVAEAGLVHGVVLAEVREHREGVDGERRVEEVVAHAVTLPPGDAHDADPHMLTRSQAEVGGNMLLEGKTAIVSGVGPGLGRSICTQFAAQGATIVAGDLDPDAVAGTVDAVVAAGGRAVGAVTDITDRAQCDALVDRAVAEFGGLDILVNDAYHGGDYSLFADADLANWRARAT